MRHFGGRVRSIALGLSAALCTAAAAQTEYTIGIGDVLNVKVWQRQDLTAQVTVDHDGTITMPLVGAVAAQGQTIARLGEDLTRRFSFVDRQVTQVTVSVTEYNSRRVFLMGQVQTPGTYSFPEIPSLWEIIRGAGGPLPDAALTRIQIIPPEGEGPPIMADLDRALSTGDYSQLPKLSPGSTIMVPRAEAGAARGDFVYVYGSVRNPGIVSLDAAGTILGAVLAAGGPAGAADLANVRVVRPGPIRARVFEVDLDAYTNDGVLYPNLDLEAGDTVTVPQAKVFSFRSLGSIARTVTQVAAATLILVRVL